MNSVVDSWEDAHRLQAEAMPSHGSDLSIRRSGDPWGPGRSLCILRDNCTGILLADPLDSRGTAVFPEPPEGSVTVRRRGRGGEPSGVGGQSCRPLREDGVALNKQVEWVAASHTWLVCLKGC